jgi:hypothetical protein
MTVLPRTRVSTLVGFGVFALLCLPSAGCKKASSPSEAPAGYGGAESESADPLTELDALEGRMQAFGLPVARAKADAEAAPAPEDDVTVAGDVAEADGEADEPELEADLAEEAVEPEPADAGPPPQGTARDERRNRCADLCSLSESICTLEVRICTLSESHGKDPVYADACERAIEDCDVAGEACDSCAG